jgi:hypothetical protein
MPPAPRSGTKIQFLRWPVAIWLAKKLSHIRIGLVDHLKFSLILIFAFGISAQLFSALQVFGMVDEIEQPSSPCGVFRM